MKEIEKTINYLLINDLLMPIICIISLIIMIPLYVKMQHDFKYKIIIQNDIYYTNTKPQINNLGKCIKFKSFDKYDIEFCDRKFQVRG